MENVSHVTVSEAAWREAGEGVVCNGVWGLEGTGITHVMDLGYSDSGCLILGCLRFYDFLSSYFMILKDVTYYVLLGIGGARERCHSQLIIGACTAIGFFCPKDFGTQQAAEQHSETHRTCGFATQLVLQHSRCCNTAATIGFATRLHCACYVKLSAKGFSFTCSFTFLLHFCTHFYTKFAKANAA